MREAVRSVCTLIVALVLGLQACAATLQDVVRESDGPYVVRNADGGWEAWWVEVTGAGARKRVQPVEPGDALAVPAVNEAPAFAVTLREPADVAPHTVRTAPGAPLFVVADTHGEYEILVRLLERHGVIDAALKWTFGSGHLIVLGDVFDRGARQTEILWLLYGLEGEAQQAGGGVHLVVGNHEAMVLSGDARYLNPRYHRSAAVLRVSHYGQLFGPETVLGQWLRTRPAVLKVNELLCLHGGLSPVLVERGFTLTEINDTVRAVLNGHRFTTQAQRERAELVMTELGPLWYRGYFADQRGFQRATSQDIDRIREHFSSETILVGHTIVPTITPLYDGRVIAVQVYPRRDERTGRPVMEALRIEDGRFMRAGVEGDLEVLDLQR